MFRNIPFLIQIEQSATYNKFTTTTTTIMKSTKRQPLRPSSSSSSSSFTAATTQKRDKQSEGKKRVRDSPIPFYHDEVASLKASVPLWDDLLQENIEGGRGQVWDDIQSRSQRLTEKFAWAIPDSRALKILSHFSPLVEIGAGKGYWARLLQDRGVDILPYDKLTYNSDHQWTKVKNGGPEVLVKSSIAERNLLLCYPDEQESIASICLENFQGEYIIHVGEMIWTGTVMGVPVAPFGRTSSADFQVSLAESFHCILQAKLSLTYPINKDCISVWKRTRFVRGRDHQTVANTEETSDVPLITFGTKKGEGKEDKKNKKKSKKEEANASSPEGDGVEFINMNDLAALREAALDQQYAEDRDSTWACIPVEEMLPVDRAASCIQHLLD